MTVKKNDIFCYTWGYDQTNIHFYKVLDVTAKTVTIRRLENRIVSSNGPMSENVVPGNEFHKLEVKPLVKRFKVVRDYRGNQAVTIRMDYNGYCELWDNKPKEATHFH